MPDKIRAAVSASVEAVSGVPEELRAVCCGVVLQHLLGQPGQGKEHSQHVESKGERAAKRRSDADLDGFMAEKKPANDREVALVVAYHRKEYEGLGSTTKGDLDAAFKEVAKGRMRRINNPAQALRDAKRDGYLDSREPGSFHLTNKGKKLVEEQLPKVG